MANRWDSFIAVCSETGCEVRKDEPMKFHTSFRIGGPADFFLIPETVNQISRLVSAAKQLELPVYLIGRGSNLLIRDEGIRGVVIAMGGKIAAMKVEKEGTIFCEAGASLESLCLFACEHGLTGLEFAYGIPGSVGGALYMNAGAYDGQISDVAISAQHIGPDGVEGVFPGDELDFSYRHSAYTGENYCITAVRLRLSEGDPKKIRLKMDELRARRKAKQPLEYPSAGSTFKRPQGNYASALIDQCGLKGFRIGGAMVSEKHAGFVINVGGASCKDVLEVMEKVQHEVQRQTGYWLEREVLLI